MEPLRGNVGETGVAGIITRSAAKALRRPGHHLPIVETNRQKLMQGNGDLRPPIFDQVPNRIQSKANVMLKADNIGRKGMNGGKRPLLQLWRRQMIKDIILTLFDDKGVLPISEHEFRLI